MAELKDLHLQYITDEMSTMRQRQRLLISPRGRLSENRTGENPTYGLTRGLRVRIYGEE
jgi:hypothetical protein